MDWKTTLNVSMIIVSAVLVVAVLIDVQQQQQQHCDQTLAHRKAASDPTRDRSLAPTGVWPRAVVDCCCLHPWLRDLQQQFCCVDETVIRVA